MIQRCPWALLAVLAVPPLAAQMRGHLLVAEGSDVLALLSRDGSQVRGSVLEVGDGRAHLEVHRSGATMKQWYDLAEFTPSSAVRIVDTASSHTDSEQQLAVAEFALGQDQIASAERALKRARQAANDATVGRELEARIGERDRELLEVEYRQQLADGELSRAHATLRKLRSRHRKTLTPDQIQAYEAELATARQSAESARAAARADAAAEKIEQKFARELAAVETRVERAEQDVQKGLTRSKSFSTALGHFKRAVRSFQSAEKSANQLIETHANQPDMGRRAVAVRDRAVGGMTDALLHTSSLQITRSQFRDAMGNVNQILARDPDNRRALAMRGRIEIAANQGWRVW